MNYDTIYEEDENERYKYLVPLEKYEFVSNNSLFVSTVNFLAYLYLTNDPSIDLLDDSLKEAYSEYFSNPTRCLSLIQFYSFLNTNDSCFYSNPFASKDIIKNFFGKKDFVDYIDSICIGPKKDEKQVVGYVIKRDQNKEQPNKEDPNKEDPNKEQQEDKPEIITITKNSNAKEKTPIKISNKFYKQRPEPPKANVVELKEGHFVKLLTDKNTNEFCAFEANNARASSEKSLTSLFKIGRVETEIDTQVKLYGFIRGEANITMCEAFPFRFPLDKSIFVSVPMEQSLVICPETIDKDTYFTLSTFDSSIIDNEDVSMRMNGVINKPRDKKNHKCSLIFCPFTLNKEPIFFRVESNLKPNKIKAIFIKYKFDLDTMTGNIKCNVIPSLEVSNSLKIPIEEKPLKVVSSLTRTFKNCMNTQNDEYFDIIVCVLASDLKYNNKSLSNFMIHPS